MPGLFEASLNATSVDRLDGLNDYPLSDKVDNSHLDNDNEVVAAINRGQRPRIVEDNGGLGIDDIVKIAKQRAPVAKLDQERLLSQAGIPKLRHIAKRRLNFRKGNEYIDATRLLNMYQLWLDDLYPRAKFGDGLAIIEKLGHGKRIQTMRREWLAEGKIHAHQEPQHLNLQIDHIAGNDSTKSDDQLGMSLEEDALFPERISATDAGSGLNDRDSWTHHQVEQSPAPPRGSLRTDGEMDQDDPDDEPDAKDVQQQQDEQSSLHMRNSYFNDEMDIMREMDSWQ